MNLETIILGNTIKEYLTAIIVFVVASIILGLIKNYAIGYLKKFSQRTKTDIDDLLIQMVERIKPSFYSFIGFYIALQTITLSETPDKILDAVFLVFVIYEAILVVQVVIDFFVKKKFIEGEEDDPGRKSAARFMSGILKASLWVVGIIMFLSNMGVNVTSLVAGLGIGGVAIALALQNVLGDLFSSLAIYMDKPFEVGDVIQVGQDRGTVEKIGIKTTRVRSLQGEEIVISNKELTSVRIQNYRRLDERRADLAFGVLYETPNEKVKRIPEIIEKIIQPIKEVRFDRCHFAKFGDSALEFEAVYHVESQDYDLFMDIQQEINQKILERFAGEGIEMAYPTRTVYINKT